VRILLLGAALAAFAQQPGGVTPTWGIRPVLRSLAEGTARLRPVIEQVRPADWTNKGAPAAYKSIHQNLRDEVSQLTAQIRELETDPERMTPLLDLYFRLQSLESLMNSLGNGARKYQNPDLADSLLDTLAQTENTRTQLRTYLMELVSTREQELKIMDREAQRCRDTILRERPQPPKPAAPKAK